MKKEFKVTCPFCSIGCRFKILKGADEVIFSPRTLNEIDYEYDDPINQGSLCPRGHFAYELLSHPRRLANARYRSNGHFREEIPEILFHKMTEELAGKNPAFPLAILIDPLLSLHDIRAILDFARDAGITALDIVAPTDRHLFRAISESPMAVPELPDFRTLQNLNSILCVGDVFTKQPVLSKYLLKAKYAMRSNRFFNINPLPTRTSWFANQFLQHSPHLEPLLLFQLLDKIRQNVGHRNLSEPAAALLPILDRHLKDEMKSHILPEQDAMLARIADHLSEAPQSAVLFSTHLYNAAGGFLSGIACQLICQLTGSYFIPLYTNSNLEAIALLQEEVYPEWKIGRAPVLQHIIRNKYFYIWAAGWDPLRLFPGSLSWPDSSRWIISSMVQTEMPAATRAVLPLSHFYEQQDLRINLLHHHYLGSEPVLSPIGSAQSMALFTYQLNQNRLARKLKLASQPISDASHEWPESIQEEITYYLDRLRQFQRAESEVWLVPTDHVAHFRDGAMTQFSSWAQKDCHDRYLDISRDYARSQSIRSGQKITVFSGGQTISLNASVKNSLPPDTVVPFAHQSDVRQLMISEFAPHNLHYYFWCPAVKVES